MQMASDIATFSRERWDGRGFPDGLTADEIPEAARIVSVCVTYCSLTTTTSHGAHWQPDDALAYMDSQAGKRFDPSMVETFRHLLAPTKQTDMTTGGTLFRPAIP
jgi:putative two-component system response regulator